jgi:hypothetical protein
VGQPLECEHTDPVSGDSLQQTSTGLAFYRKSTNTPTFTTGYDHWALTPQGLHYWTGSSVDPPIARDNFSDSTSGWWPTVETDRIALGYDGATYRMALQEPSLTIGAAGWTELEVADVTVEADVAAGPGDVQGGPACRMQADGTTYYSFVVRTNGVASILINGADPRVLASSQALPKLIHPGEATNQVRAQCRGSHLSMEVNGTKVVEVDDISLDSGWIGLSVGTVTSPSGEVHFDNVQVYVP